MLNGVPLADPAPGRGGVPVGGPGLADAVAMLGSVTVPGEVVLPCPGSTTRGRKEPGGLSPPPPDDDRVPSRGFELEETWQAGVFQWRASTQGCIRRWHVQQTDRQPVLFHSLHAFLVVPVCTWMGPSKSITTNEVRGDNVIRARTMAKACTPTLVGRRRPVPLCLRSMPHAAGQHAAEKTQAQLRPRLSTDGPCLMRGIPYKSILCLIDACCWFGAADGLRKATHRGTPTRSRQGRVRKD